MHFVPIPIVALTFCRVSVCAFFHFDCCAKIRLAYARRSSCLTSTEHCHTFALFRSDIPNSDIQLLAKQKVKERKPSTFLKQKWIQIDLEHRESTWKPQQLIKCRVPTVQRLSQISFVSRAHSQRGPELLFGKIRQFGSSSSSSSLLPPNYTFRSA